MPGISALFLMTLYVKVSSPTVMAFFLLKLVMVKVPGATPSASMTMESLAAYAAGSVRGGDCSRGATAEELVAAHPAARASGALSKPEQQHGNHQGISQGERPTKAEKIQEAITARCIHH